MTDKERLDRERNWVETRLNCTVDNTFKELIAVIVSDIASFNRLSGQNDCKISREHEREVIFSRGSRAAGVSTDGSAINVMQMYGGSRLSDFKIKPKWSDDEMQYDLIIDGEKVSMHRASQRIIGDVLFS